MVNLNTPVIYHIITVICHGIFILENVGTEDITSVFLKYLHQACPGAIYIGEILLALLALAPWVRQKQLECFLFIAAMPKAGNPH